MSYSTGTCTSFIVIIVEILEPMMITIYKPYGREEKPSYLQVTGGILSLLEHTLGCMGSRVLSKPSQGKP
jgi:hypothetical protein